jgi:hypothetical protein
MGGWCGARRDGIGGVLAGTWRPLPPARGPGAPLQGARPPIAGAATEPPAPRDPATHLLARSAARAPSSRARRAGAPQAPSGAAVAPATWGGKGYGVRGGRAHAAAQGAAPGSEEGR